MTSTPSREIKNLSKASSVLVALGSVSAALGSVPVHIPGGMYDISLQCLPWAAVECAQCSILNKSVNEDLFISKAACDQSIFNVTENTLH